MKEELLSFKYIYQEQTLLMSVKVYEEKICKHLNKKLFNISGSYTKEESKEKTIQLKLFIKDNLFELIKDKLTTLLFIKQSKRETRNSPLKKEEKENLLNLKEAITRNRQCTLYEYYYEELIVDIFTVKKIITEAIEKQFKLKNPNLNFIVYCQSIKEMPTVYVKDEFQMIGIVNNMFYIYELPAIKYDYLSSNFYIEQPDHYLNFKGFFAIGISQKGISLEDITEKDIQKMSIQEILDKQQKLCNEINSTIK